MEKRPEEALRQSEGRIQAILDTAADAIITIDQLGVIENVNHAAERVFGYSASELIGRNISMLMPSPHRERHDEYLAHYIRTGEAKVIGIGRELEARAHRDWRRANARHGIRWRPARCVPRVQVPKSFTEWLVSISSSGRHF